MNLFFGQPFFTFIFKFWYVWLFVILLIIIGLILEILSGKKELPLKYLKKDSLLTPLEKPFYEVLKVVATELNLELFAKVRLADIIYANRRDPNWMTEWNKIKSKHVDFLLCDKQNYSPLIIIELDDSSHEREDRILSDNFKNEMIPATGLKIVRFKIQQNYSKEELKTRIKA